MQINNWSDLINKLNDNNDNKGVFINLLNEINVFINSCKFDEDFSLDQVKNQHYQKFNQWKLYFEQLMIETDITHISSKIPYISTRGEIIINMTTPGKWIQFHTRDVHIEFIDEEKTIINDKPLANFLNKMHELIPQYKYFGKHPLVYYKFKTMPDPDIVEYMQTFGVTAICFTDKTNIFECPNTFGEKVLLDQAVILTMCSNLSCGLSDSYYESTKENINKDTVIASKNEIDEYLNNKQLLVCQSVYDQTKVKMEFTAGPQETIRFLELLTKITIVPDCQNDRFLKMKTKENEIICISVAEREGATIVTNNKHIYKKISLFYQEIPCKLFASVQLTETKYN
ncbi:DUF1308 domain-containing protein [Megavirus chiliensis]|uniref:DUF1308 domain-containing protein n=3 Tax=Megamimivirinae TaxID=3044648 RepID=A0A2L2DLW4_MIMIV|nr:hypothetical protein MegaChil _gp0320 [Megavirus chiliensis]AEQ33466.1 DUF1308 domain-containing protein [Megavirus chiliensis]AGD92225.1 hypothetical protein LBA_00305 [Megavirus lba]AVG47155.1 hypothetical protein [Acanthamoeba polyphaga mimivirus]